MDNTLVLSNWKLNDIGLADGSIELNANTTYTIKIEYYNAMNEAELNLLWELPSAQNQSWFSKLWYDEKLTVIPLKYLSLPTTEPVFRA